MVKLTGVSGKSGAGKTSFADHAVKVFGGVKIAMADALRDEVSGFLLSIGANFEQRHLYGTQADREESFEVSMHYWCASDYRPRRVLNGYVKVRGNTVSLSYRSLLQLWGTEYRRAQDPHYWETKVEERLREIEEGLVIIDDIRFESEAQMVLNNNGRLVRVNRPGRARIATPDHESETALDTYPCFNWHIFNGGSLDDFQEEVEHVMGFMI